MSHGDPLLGSGDHAPVGVDGGVHDRLDPPVALGGDDDPPVAQRDPRTEQRQPVARRVAQQRDVAARGAEHRREVARAGRRAGLADELDVRAVVVQLRREGQRDRPAAGEHDPLGPAVRAGS